MYISETDLTRRILTGQIEILNEVTNEIEQRLEKALFTGDTQLSESLSEMKIGFSTYRTTLTREKAEITKTHLDKSKHKLSKKQKKNQRRKENDVI